MKKTLCMLLAILAAAGLILHFPFGSGREPVRDKGVRVTRVWIAPGGEALSFWVRKQAGAYEKQTGNRVYIRMAPDTEAEAALRGDREAMTPDLMMQDREGTVMALQGYALFLRDETGEKKTPAPTAALFSPPTPAPAPPASPAPMPDPESLAPILIPASWPYETAGGVPCADPRGEFAGGKGNAAVLTAGQAEELPFAVRAYALSRGFLPLYARAFTERGEGFLSFLLSASCQQALSAAGLYSPEPSLTLYGEDQPVRALIERSR